MKLYYVLFLGIYLTFCYGIEARQMDDYNRFKLAVTDSLRIMQKYEEPRLVDSEMIRVCRERGISRERVTAYIEKLRAMDMGNFVIREKMHRQEQRASSN